MLSLVQAVTSSPARTGEGDASASVAAASAPYPKMSGRFIATPAPLPFATASYVSVGQRQLQEAATRLLSMPAAGKNLVGRYDNLERDQEYDDQLQPQ